jgi:polyisoprenoid-binding protein YceI
MTTTATPTPQKRRSKSRSPLTWLIVAVVVIVALAIIGPFVYIHFFNGDAPAPLTLSSSGSPSSTAAAGGSSSGGAALTQATLNGAWKVDTGSQAGYRVSEVLVGQSTQAVGRTSSVTGTATIANDQLTAASMTVDMKSVKSDKAQRDEQFQDQIMETSQFPTSTFVLTKPVDLSKLPTDGSTGSTTATGNLTLHGVTKSVDVPLQVKVDGSDIDVQGSVAVHFSDYNVANPSNGLAKVGDDGTMEFLVKLTKS